MEFVSIDLENVVFSSHGGPVRIPCAFAMIKYQAKKVSATCSGLIQPPENYYDGHTVQYHHIRPAMTEGISFFPDAWSLMKTFVGDLPLIAHFFSFSERSILTDAIKYYDLDFPDWKLCGCTGQMAIELEDRTIGRGLNVLSAKHGIPLDHHDPLSDAMACLRLAQVYGELLGEVAFRNYFKPFEEYPYVEASR